MKSRALLVAIILAIALISVTQIALADGLSWTQNDWSGGSGQTSWSNSAKYSSASSVSAGSGSITLAAKSGWYNASWKYRQSVAVTNGLGSVLTNYQIPIFINTAGLITGGKMKADCSDLRIIDADGNSLPLWIASAPSSNTCGQSATKVWVKLSSLPAAGTSLKIYYGNSGASAISNGTNVFTNFADFTTGSSLPSGWTKTDIGTSGTATVGGGSLTISNTNGEDVWYRIYGGTHVYSTTTVTGSFVAETLVTSQTNSSEWAKTGISAENSVAAAVSNGQAFIIVTPGNGVAFQYQDAYGDSCVGGCTAPNTQTNGGSYSFPQFLQLKKDASNQMSGYYSSDGANWNQQGSTVSPDGIASSQYVGLMITPHFTTRTSTSTYSFFYVRSYAATEPTVGSPQSEEGIYETSGSLTSSIFDTGAASDFGALIYASSSATNTALTVKVRTSNNSDMSGATDFASCNAISSGSDISGNNCVSDQHRYIQYQVAVSSSDGLYTPALASVSLQYSSAQTYTLSYSAGAHGSLSGSQSQTVLAGGSSSAVTAVPSIGYVFSSWSDGSTDNPRSDSSVAGDLSVSAVFQAISGSKSVLVIMPSGVGSGAADVAASMIGMSINVGEIKSAGTNILTYITNRNSFAAAESAKKWSLGDHVFVIADLNLYDYSAVLNFDSSSTFVTLKKGESAGVDLDGDKISDIKVTFIGTYANRAEITVSSLAGSTAAAATASVAGNSASKQSAIAAFKKNLSLGMKNPDVKLLQQYLNGHGYVIAAAGAGSSGQETTYFGLATRNALIKFQQVGGIKPANGFFGPLTRNFINNQ